MNCGCGAGASFVSGWIEHKEAQGHRSGVVGRRTLLQRCWEYEREGALMPTHWPTETIECGRSTKSDWGQPLSRVALNLPTSLFCQTVLHSDSELFWPTRQKVQSKIREWMVVVQCRESTSKRESSRRVLSAVRADKLRANHLCR